MHTTNHIYTCDVCGDTAERGQYPKFTCVDPGYRKSYAIPTLIFKHRRKLRFWLSRPTSEYGNIRQQEMHLCARHKQAIINALNS